MRSLVDGIVYNVNHTFATSSTSRLYFPTFELYCPTAIVKLVSERIRQRTEPISPFAPFDPKIRRLSAPVRKVGLGSGRLGYRSAAGSDRPAPPLREGILGVLFRRLIGAEREHVDRFRREAFCHPSRGLRARD